MDNDKTETENYFRKIIEENKEESKSRHSQQAIKIFVIFGTLLFILEEDVVNPIKAFIIFYGVGIFVISLLSSVTYGIEHSLAKRLKGSQISNLRKYSWVFKTIFILAMTYLLYTWYMRIVN